MSRHIDLILRTCDNVDCHSGGKRLVDVPRIELTLRSLSSLLHSASRFLDATYHTDEVNVVLVDDNSSQESKDRMVDLCTSLNYEATLVPVIGNGNGDSLKTHYEWAKANSKDIIYFLEDDYVHDITMLYEMVDFFGTCEQRPGMDQVILHPCDYPDRYHRELYQSWILLGKFRHWRSIYHTTSTMMLTHKTLVKFWKNYMALTRYGKDRDVTEDTSINKVYRTVHCFSPMPSLSTHVQYKQTLSPFTDWITLWNAHEPEVPSHK